MGGVQEFRRIQDTSKASLKGGDINEDSFEELKERQNL